MELPRGGRGWRRTQPDPSVRVLPTGIASAPESSKSCGCSSSFSYRETLAAQSATNGDEGAAGDVFCTSKRPDTASQQQHRQQDQLQPHKNKHHHRSRHSHKPRRQSPANGNQPPYVGQAKARGVAGGQQRQQRQQRDQHKKQHPKQHLPDALAHRKDPSGDVTTTREASPVPPSLPSAAAGVAAAAASEEPDLKGQDRLHWSSHFRFTFRDFDASSPYLPVALLGEGAIGRVFRCTEKSSGDSVAVKVVSKHPLRSRSRLRQHVLVEKEALVALSAGGRSVHPSVVHLRRTYQTSDSLYFVLRYAGAASLRDVLLRIRCAGLTLSAGAARLWAAEAAAALAAMRKRGVLHRDIRPENIVVSHDGHLTLVDFDSALCLRKQQQQQQAEQKQQQQQRDKETTSHQSQRQHAQQKHPQQQQGAEGLKHAASPEALDPNGNSSSNNSSSSSNNSSSAGGSSRNACEVGPERLQDVVMHPYVGTAAYAAPELFVPLDAYGEEAALAQVGCGFGTDCWSLGCLVHELLLGEPPFKGPSTPALARAVCGAQELSLPQQLPAAAADLIRGLLRPKEEERLGSRDVRELLEHPFFNGIDCMAVHFNPMPIDVMQYAVAFRESGRAGRAAAAAALGCGSAGFGGDGTAAAAADAAAVEAAAVSVAALDAELTPSIGCPFSPLKCAAAEAAHVCVCCDSSKTCVCCGEDLEAIPVSPGPSLTNSNSRSTEVLTGRGVFEAAAGAREWKRTSGGCFGDGADVQEEQQQEQQEPEVMPLRSECIEEPQATCRRSVTDAVLGWGPPLRLRPVSSADYPEADDQGVRAAQGAAAIRAEQTAAAVGAGVEGPLRAASSAGSNVKPLPEGMQPSGLSSGSFRDSQGHARGAFPVSQDAPPNVAKWLLKGERMQYHGVLLRMREHRSFCERLFIRLFGKGHKRNCQLQPQRCFAVLTDAGRLLLMDPNGRTLRKTVVLASDGEIYTEGRDMLIYSSAKDNCYLLFASEEKTVSVWARSLAGSIENLQRRGAYGRSQSAAYGQRTNTDGHTLPSVEPLSLGTFASPTAAGAQDRETAVAPSPWTGNADDG
ncbi:AGC kinase, putative [Eimeria brunetti]|uniref:non-specific serine/threonine protein kinase n=1 Tax=Eimeria brunetti TaxID=51314 RepID=U6LWW7_9EIME|nr:AGC kinase, putative [Eimeria brunetti]